MPDAEAMPQEEGLTQVVSFRITPSEKSAVRLLASVDPDGLSESEVLRSFFDAAGLRAKADQIRARIGAAA